MCGICSAGTPAVATSLATLSQLTGLTSLKLDHASGMCDEVAWDLAALTHLAHLSLTHSSQLTDACLPAMWTLTALTHLDLSHSGVAGLPGELSCPAHELSSTLTLLCRCICSVQLAFDSHMLDSRCGQSESQGC